MWRWAVLSGRAPAAFGLNSKTQPCPYWPLSFCLLCEGGPPALASPWTPSSNEGKQPGRQEVRWCHKITRLFVHASIGSLVLAFCSGEQRSGARLLTWPLDNWISEDMMWCVRIHTHSGVWWEVILGMHAEWEQRYSGEWDSVIWNVQFEMFLSEFIWDPDRKLLVVPVTLLGTVRGAERLLQPAQHGCTHSPPSVEKGYEKWLLFCQLLIDKNWQWKLHKG